MKQKSFPIKTKQKMLSDNVKPRNKNNKKKDGLRDVYFC